ncbi:S-layer homology domain-containing protein [uncultured Flavonifractor sp.]|uniref:S-layer homology domain-containing protein n=1 Tax=uncultured Flavonifractor sp. TaxID=1193534 RepID=UPI00261E2809|nr:S-layer homology domain-containing protein [uncultured Flavonifractor sp.]
MRRMKRWLSIVLCLVMVLGLLPATALAADTSWAESAVSTLNGIYGSGTFSATDAEMTVGNATTVLNKMGASTDKLTDEENDTSTLTRSTACEVLADVFGLPVDESESAIAYLYNQNIINGKSENDLNKNGSVSQAEFAVLTYRVLNSVGGGKGSSVDVLKPGTDEYFAWMYLAARACVPFQSSQINKKMSEATFWVNGNQVVETDPGDGKGYTKKTGEKILTYWNSKIDSDNSLQYSADSMLINVAKTLVDSINAGAIFSDVEPGNYQNGGAYYDGVMYLFDHGILNGNGDGTFTPNTEAKRFELAVMLARAAGTSSTPVDAINAAVKNGYMKGETVQSFDPQNPGEWGNPVTREEAIVAIVKAFVSQNDINNVNTAILDRFFGSQVSSQIQDAEKCIAYAVSIGLVQGTGTSLDLNSSATRGALGVLLYRTLIGVDKTKMKDYADNVSYAKGEETAQTFSLLATPLAEENKTLTLREDWRLTSNLDLKVPERTTLTIQGNGHYIYEMGGELQNSGLGKVVFTEGTILYPAGTSGVCTTDTSDQLMMERQPHKVNIAETQNGTVTTTFSTAKMGDTVSLTITSEQGYELDTLTVTAADGTTIAVTNNSFTMPASDVTVSATFKQADTTPTPALTLTANPSSLSGGGTVTLTVTGAAEGSAVNVTCSNALYNPTLGTNGTWTVTLPNETASYTFTAAAEGYTSAPYTVYVTRYSSNNNSSSGSSSSGSSTSGVTGSGDDVSVSVSGGSVTTSQMESAVKKADEGAPITIEADSASGVSLPAGGLADAVDNDNDLVVELRYGEIIVSARAAAGLTDGISSKEKVEISVTRQRSSDEEELAGLLERGAVLFDVSVEAGGASVHSFDGTLTLTFTVPNLEEIDDPHVLHILADGSREYYTPDRISSNTITVRGIRNLSTFAVIPGSEIPVEPVNPFVDVDENDYYYDAVLWAVANGVTNGTTPDGTLYSPDLVLSRAQMVTFLWRVNGAPRVTGSSPFTDVNVGDYYYDAVLWAVANGVTTGTTSTTFSPELPVTRAQAVTFQWRAAGSPVVSGGSFVDVPADAWYANAVAWAVANGITNGTGGGIFSPDMEVSRAQAVTFLYREQK